MFEKPSIGNQNRIRVGGSSSFIRLRPGNGKCRRLQIGVDPAVRVRSYLTIERFRKSRGEEIARKERSLRGERVKLDCPSLPARPIAVCPRFE